LGNPHRQKNPADEIQNGFTNGILFCVLLFFFKSMDSELSHDILCRRAAMTTAEPLESFASISNQRFASS
jgi:hypothetical protein